MPPRRKPNKREATVAPDGLISPEESFTYRVATKQEIDLTDCDGVELSTPASSIRGYDQGPSNYEDEGYASRMEQQRRSSSLSVPTSRFPPPSHRHEHVNTPLPAAQGLQFVGRNVKLLVDAINDLRNYGLDDTVQLPELVLVGDQSAGKSSLMSALTEVRLPRDQGICTKCPANITTSPGESWSCKISLQQDHRYENPNGKPINPTKAQPFAPWVSQTLVTKKFNTITDPHKLEDNIKWAQIALLNHNANHSLFVPETGVRAQGDYQTERDNTEAKFSPNCIAIAISGPGLPALSFYDLPGVFRIASDPKDQYLAKVIENLAIKYIRRPNALIIWTLAMKNDPSTSNTGKVIQDCKAHDRCVGVLTNPDHVAARHMEYEKVLSGKAHRVQHGYFVTKQPGENETYDNEYYHVKAREAETFFFDNNALWQGDWRDFRDRCGTSAIQEFLSKALASQIIQTLPSIKQRAFDRLQQVDHQLASCPDLPDTDVRSSVLQRLADFTTDVKGLMKGDPTLAATIFRSSWSARYEQFRDLILYVKPMFIVAHESDHATPNVIDLSSDCDEEDHGRLSPQIVRKRSGVSLDRSPAARQRYSDVVDASAAMDRGVDDFGVKREHGTMIAPPTPPRQTLRNGNGYTNPFAGSPYAQLANQGKNFMRIAGIRETIKKNTMPGLPDLVTPETYNELCMLSLAPWRFVLDVFIDQVFAMVRKQLHGLLLKNLGDYKKTALFEQASAILDGFLDELEKGQRMTLQELHGMETYKAFTVNESSLNNYKSEELAGLTSSRRKVRARAFVERQMREDVRKRFPQDMPFEERKSRMDKMIESVKDEQLGRDSFELELGVAAYVRAYYKTAGLRFADSVSLSMNGRFFRQIKESISFLLEEKLGIMDSRDGEEVCRNLMEEDDTYGRQRRELKHEKQRLIAFTNRLEELVAQIESSNGTSSPTGTLYGAPSAATDAEDESMYD